MFIPQIDLIDLDAGDQFMLDYSDLINVEKQRFQRQHLPLQFPTLK